MATMNILDSTNHNSLFDGLFDQLALTLYGMRQFTVGQRIVGGQPQANTQYYDGTGYNGPIAAAVENARAALVNTASGLPLNDGDTLVVAVKGLTNFIIDEQTNVYAQIQGLCRAILNQAALTAENEIVIPRYDPQLLDDSIQKLIQDLIVLGNYFTPTHPYWLGGTNNTGVVQIPGDKKASGAAVAAVFAATLNDSGEPNGPPGNRSNRTPLIENVTAGTTKIYWDGFNYRVVGARSTAPLDEWYPGTGNDCNVAMPVMTASSSFNLLGSSVGTFASAFGAPTNAGGTPTSGVSIPVGWKLPAGVTVSAGVSPSTTVYRDSTQSLQLAPNTKLWLSIPQGVLNDIDSTLALNFFWQTSTLAGTVTASLVDDSGTVITDNSAQNNTCTLALDGGGTISTINQWYSAALCATNAYSSNPNGDAGSYFRLPDSLPAPTLSGSTGVWLELSVSNDAETVLFSDLGLYDPIMASGHVPAPHADYDAANGFLCAVFPYVPGSTTDNQTCVAATPGPQWSGFVGVLKSYSVTSSSSRSWIEFLNEVFNLANLGYQVPTAGYNVIADTLLPDLTTVALKNSGINVPE